MSSNFVVVYGGSGALGTTVVEKFKSSHTVISVDLRENPSAHHNILLPTSGLGLKEQGEVVENKLKAILSDNKLEAILCVAGGWAGGDASDPNFLTNSSLMIQQSLWTSLISVRMSSLFLKEGGLLVLTGAKPALAPTPGMVPYGVAKAGVHFLTQSITSGLPKDAKCVCILPVTLDTPMNRKFMKHDDTWTPLEDVANILSGWNANTMELKGNSLCTIVTAKGETKATFI